MILSKGRRNCQLMSSSIGYSLSVGAFGLIPRKQEPDKPIEKKKENEKVEPVAKSTDIEKEPKKEEKK